SLLEQLAEIKGKLKVETAQSMSNVFSIENFTNKFTHFRQSFEQILDSLKAENIQEVNQKLRELVKTFGKFADPTSHEAKPVNDELLNQKKALDLKLESLVKEIHEQNNAKGKLLAEEKQKKGFLTEDEKKFRSKSAELGRLKDDQNLVLVEKAKLDTRLESLHKEIKEALGEGLVDL